MDQPIQPELLQLPTEVLEIIVPFTNGHDLLQLQECHPHFQAFRPTVGQLEQWIESKVSEIYASPGFINDYGRDVRLEVISADEKLMNILVLDPIYAELKKRYICSLVYLNNKPKVAQLALKLLNDQQYYDSIDPKEIARWFRFGLILQDDALAVKALTLGVDKLPQLAWHEDILIKLVDKFPHCLENIIDAVMNTERKENPNDLLLALVLCGKSKDYDDRARTILQLVQIKQESDENMDRIYSTIPLETWSLREMLMKSSASFQKSMMKGPPKGNFIMTCNTRRGW